MPYVFEVPTTLEALHDMIAKYAATGKDASLIIERIHASNSVRLNKRNGEKMQNFYDVVLRRFVAVGDAIYMSGDGGPDLGRYEQLNALTKVLYGMSQDAPESAGAVWGRRLGVIQNAHAKRLRDAEFVQPEDEEGEAVTAWPDSGIMLLLKTVGLIFPVTDLRHQVVTPTMLLLGQMVAQTPVRSVHDLVMGVMSCGLMIEYTREAKRIAPEALAFLASVLRLFGPVPTKTPVPTIEAAWQIPELHSLRKSLEDMDVDVLPVLSFERDVIQDPCMIAGVLVSTLQLVRFAAKTLEGALNSAETEAFAEVSSALLAMKSKSSQAPLPKMLADKVFQCAAAVSDLVSVNREPLQRRSDAAIEAIKSLAPRMEDPSKYTFSKDKGKSAKQAELDRNRREYKREHKAVSRELRLDAVFVEKERRQEKDVKDKKAKDKRNKNFAWLEGEQAAMNQQVAQGGGLLSGGGMGAARAKAKSGKMGIKKGGKL
jgi:nucleolar protein 14